MQLDNLFRPNNSKISPGYCHNIPVINPELILTETQFIAGGLKIEKIFLSEELYCSVFTFYFSKTKFKMEQPSVIDN